MSDAQGVPEAAALPDEKVRELSLERYRIRAAGYDDTCGPTWPIRERTVAATELQPGQCVLDVGCGTGLSLGLLRAAVGATGRVYAFDQSPEMLAQARRRVAREGWSNVTLLHAAAHDVQLPELVDALFFHYTHDILRSVPAIDALLACARPGAAVAIAGVKYFPWWLAPLNPWVYLKNRGYNGAPGGLRSPWDLMAPRLEHWRMKPVQFGMGYIGTGRIRATGSTSAGQ